MSQFQPKFLNAFYLHLEAENHWDLIEPSYHMFNYYTENRSICYKIV